MKTRTRTRKPWSKRKLLAEFRKAKWRPVDGLPGRYVSPDDTSVVINLNRYINGKRFEWEVWAGQRKTPPTRNGL